MPPSSSLPAGGASSSTFRQGSGIGAEKLPPSSERPAEARRNLPTAEKPGREFCLFNTSQYERLPFSLKNIDTHIYHQLKESKNSSIPLKFVCVLFFSPPNLYPSTLLVFFFGSNETALEAGLKWIYGGPLFLKFISQLGDLRLSRDCPQFHLWALSLP